MAPIGWQLPGLVWLCALAWAMLDDRIKLLAHRIDASRQPASATAAAA